MMIANVLDIIHYLILGAYSGFATKLMALLRNEIILLKEKNKKLNTNTTLTILLIIYLAIGFLTYSSFYSILPVIVAIIYLSFVWNGNELQVKKIAFYCYFLWLTYNICIFSPAGILTNVVAIISTFIAVKDENKERIKIKE